MALEGGSWNSYGATVDISSSLNEDGSVRGRLLSKHTKSDSFIDGYKKEQTTVYGVVNTDISDQTSFSFGASYQKLDRDGVRWGGLPAYYTDGTRTNFPTSSVISEDWTYWNEEKKSIFANFKHFFNNNISLNTSYNYERTDGESNLLYFFTVPNKSDGSGASASGWKDSSRNTMHNFDVNLDIPFKIADLKQQIILGATYNNNKKVYLKALQTYSGYTVSNYFNYNLPEVNGIDEHITDIENEQKSLYLASRFSITKNLKLIAGTRLLSFERKYLNEDNDSNKFNKFIPYVGVVYDINDNHSVYASYTSIFKPQDYVNINGEYLDSIEGNNYEVGIKGEYFDGVLNATLSVFRIEQDNVGEDTGLTSGGKEIYRQVEGVTSKGYELDLNGAITKNLNLNFSLAHFNAKNADEEPFNTTAARTTANLYTTYKVNKLTLGAGLQYKGKSYTENLYGYNFNRITQKAVTIANAMLKYKMTKNISWQVNVNNIFDKKYYDGIGLDSMNYATPRNLKVALKYTF